MGDVTGGGGVLSAYIVEVLNTRRVVALVPGAYVAAIVSKRFAPGVVDAGAQIVGITLTQRSLPRDIIRGRGVVQIVSGTQQRVRTDTGDSVRFVQGPPQVELYSANSDHGRF